MKPERKWYKRKKVIATISGCLVVIATDYFNIDKETSLKIVGILASFIIGQGVSDMGKEMS